MLLEGPQLFCQAGSLVLFFPPLFSISGSSSFPLGACFLLGKEI